MVIDLKEICKDYIQGKEAVPVLKNVNLSVDSGEYLAIMGPSGSGKSTLMNIIGCLDRQTSGNFIFDGSDISVCKDKELSEIRNKKIGFVFQNFNLLMQRTVLDNVCFPMEIAGVDKKTAREKAREFLKVVELSDKEKAYPAQLSGGQKQRVAIARAMAMNPTILLCDEATSALDPTTTKSILALLKDINEKYGITIVIITHSMEVVQEICTHVAIIDAGELAENGTVADVFASPKSRAAKKLVFQGDQKVAIMKSRRCIRIVFTKNSSFEPVIANMVLECRASVNILMADTQDIGGIATGQMILQLPEENQTADKMIAYLREKNLTVEELKDYVE